MKATLQRFKENDEEEKRYIEALLPIFDEIGDGLDSFYNGAFEAYDLGDILYELDRDPMSGVITQEIFRASFPAIHELFTQPGPFEFYLTVFRAIWGEDVEIVFTIPQPGVLLINAEVLDVETYDLIAREVVNNVYEYSELVDHDGDKILVRGMKGIKTQSEINALMNEITPDGIYVQTTLSL